MNYRRVYALIVLRAKQEEKSGLRKKGNGNYYEAHHILPRSLFPNWTKRKSNVVLLTAREHFFCHQLLTKIYPTPQMFLALCAFINRPNAGIKEGYRITSREYERLRIKYSNYMKDLMKNHPERNIGNFSKGKKWFTNGKLNKFCYECPEGFWLGRTFSEEHRKNVSRINSRLRRGSKASEETKAKMRANGGKAIGERNSSFRKKWWTNGLDNVLAFDCPFGYRKGRAISKETINKIQATKKLNKKPAWNKGMNKASQELYREKLQEKVRTSPVLANNSN